MVVLVPPSTSSSQETTFLWGIASNTLRGVSTSRIWSRRRWLAEERRLAWSSTVVTISPCFACHFMDLRFGTGRKSPLICSIDCLKHALLGLLLLRHDTIIDLHCFCPQPSPPWKRSCRWRTWHYHWEKNALQDTLSKVVKASTLRQVPIDELSWEPFSDTHVPSSIHVSRGFFAWQNMHHLPLV